MTIRTVASLVLAAGLMATPGQSALTQATDHERTDPQPLIEVSVDCYSSPERVKVANDRAKPIRIRSIGSTYQRRAGEPYRVRKVLRPGKNVTFTFGTGKGGKRLSGSFIFDNGAPKEGVLVKTDRGKVKVRCSEGTNVPPEVPQAVPIEPVPIPSGGSISVLETLAGLSVASEVEDGYDRGLFEHWIDADGDGCDTRKEVLMAESLTPVTPGDGCSIESGTWYSAPDSDTLTNPSSIDINHVVPLKEAWASGAHAWSPERREAFANDLTDERTLQAVSAGVNRQQGERDPASWLPANRVAACQFVADWVAIKANWALSVDEEERDAIAVTLQFCDSVANQDA